MCCGALFWRMVISIHAPREGGDYDFAVTRVTPYISIHAPREGGDVSTNGLGKYPYRISIHAPREGGDAN